MFDPDFDRQKLMYHPAEVAYWLAEGRSRGPIYTELEVSNRCNCRCLFCGVDHQVNANGEVMGLDLAHKVITGLAELGAKSIMVCGHGEPLLNPEIVAIVRLASRQTPSSPPHGRTGMSVSMTTNGVALTQDKLPLIDHLEWIRFSVNGGSPEDYGLVHGVPPETFARVLANIRAAVERKKALKLPLTIGVQLVLLPENVGLVVDLAQGLKAIGVDYFSVKPYSQHPLSRNRLAIDYSRLPGVAEGLRPLADQRFKVIFRAESMRRAGSAKAYGRCHGTQFLSFISANGDVWACNVFAGDPRFLLGNATRQTLPEIWTGARRQEVVSYIEERHPLSECRDLCRLDACNRYLWRLKSPWPHDNFI